MGKYIFGDRIFHKIYKQDGKFKKYDDVDETYCFVKFDGKDGLEDEIKRVSLNQIEKVRR